MLHMYFSIQVSSR